MVDGLETERASEEIILLFLLSKQNLKMSCVRSVF